MSRSTTGSHGKNWIDRKSKTRGTDYVKTRGRPSRRPSTVTERRAKLGFQWRLLLLLSSKRTIYGRLVYRIQRRFLLDGHHTVSHPSPRLSSNMKQLEMLRLRDSGPIAARKIIWLVTFVCALRRRQRSGRITGWSRHCRTWKYCRIITVVQFGIKIKDCGSKFHQSMGGRGMHDERRAE